MGVLEFAGLVVLSVVLAVVVRWFDPGVTQLARRTGLDARRGWVAYLIAIVLVFLPVAFGAPVGDGAPDAWIVGSALAAVGVFLAVLATTTVDEYRALGRATVVDVPTLARRSATDELVAVSATPRVEGDVSAPVSGEPAVHADWLVQARQHVGFRKRWRNRATGVHRTPFALDAEGRVRVVPRRERAFAGASREVIVSFGPDDPLPDRLRDLLADREGLPAPDDRDNPFRFVEKRVPADATVTVVGIPRTTADGVEIREGPPDEWLGTDAAGDGDPPGPVLIAGTVDEARRHLHRRVRWLGAAGVGLVVVGELLAFWLAPL